MKKSCPTNRALPSLPVIRTARAGDAEAIDRILRHYGSYINKLCTRKLYDKTNTPHNCLDEYMKRRLEIKLIQAIIGL